MISHVFLTFLAIFCLVISGEETRQFFSILNLDKIGYKFLPVCDDNFNGILAVVHSAPTHLGLRKTIR
jgi:hypothetical protein